MKPIKKFSMISKKPTSILESSNLSPEAIDELVKKMGYDNLEEVKKEKALLSKLEALLKEFNPKQDVSEDDSEEIEDEVIAKGEPKSLEGKEGEKEEDKETGATEEIEEEEDSEIEDTIDDDDDDDDKSDEIEDKGNEEGEPEDADDSEEVEIDAEITDDVPADSTDSPEEAKTKRKIKTFEEFTMESEETINKNVKYTDDEDEKEDYALPVAESVNASGYIKAGKLGYNDQFRGRQSLSKTLSLDLGLNPRNEFSGPWIGFDHVSMYINGKDGGTVLADALTGKYTYDELKKAAAEFMGIKESVVTESEVKSADEFKEYATSILKKAFGEDYDEAKATDVIDGLLSKYKEDYGAMVGALQSTMGQ